MQKRLSTISKAIRKNGLTQTTGIFLGIDPNKGPSTYTTQPMLFACAIGQAAYNLNLDPCALHAALDYGATFPDPDEPQFDTRLGAHIIKMNDQKRMTYVEIADWLDNWIKEHGDPLLSFNNEYDILKYKKR